MGKLVWNCQIITPMFLHGINQDIPEFRPPSLKGVMRYWWRAAQAEPDMQRLKQTEDRIFGDSGNEGKSKFSISIMVNNDQLNRRPQKILPHHTGDRHCPYLPMCENRNNPGICSKGRSFQAIVCPQHFQVIFRFGKLPEEFNEEHLQALFKLTALLGGLGKRSRRGFGSFSILSERIGDKEEEILNRILQLLGIIAKGNYKIDKDENTSKHVIKLSKPCDARYPFIRTIQVGREYPHPFELLKTIGKASHDHNDDSLGTVRQRMRFASPVYVSVVKSRDGYRPIITTLQMAFQDQTPRVDTEKQRLFKGAIL